MNTAAWKVSNSSKVNHSRRKQVCQELARVIQQVKELKEEPRDSKGHYRVAELELARDQIGELQEKVGMFSEVIQAELEAAYNQDQADQAKEKAWTDDCLEYDNLHAEANSAKEQAVSLVLVGRTEVEQRTKEEKERKEQLQHDRKLELENKQAEEVQKKRDDERLAAKEAHNRQLEADRVRQERDQRFAKEKADQDQKQADELAEKAHKRQLELERDRRLLEQQKTDQKVAQREADRKLKEQRQELEKERLKVEKDRLAAEAESANTSATVSGNGGHKVKIPPMTVPIFSGNKLKWYEFWEAFEVSIHKNQRVETLEKFNYLRQHLTGEPAIQVNSFPMTASSYSDAVELLGKMYGDKQEIRKQYQRKLMDMRPVLVMNTGLLRTFHGNMAATLRVLKTMGVNMNIDFFYDTFIQKIPEEVRVKFVEYCQWTETEECLEELCEFIHQFLVIQEKVSGTKATGTQPQAGVSPGAGSVPGPSSRGLSGTFGRGNSGGRIQSSGSTLTVQTGWRTNRPCAFCLRLGHPSWDCPSYTDPQARKTLLQERGNCIKCLGYHPQAECNIRGACNRCNDVSHNTAICPTRGQGPSGGGGASSRGGNRGGNG